MIKRIVSLQPHLQIFTTCELVQTPCFSQQSVQQGLPTFFTPAKAGVKIF
jgi:hypothetical protein